MVLQSIVLACADSVFLSEMRSKIEKNFEAEIIELIDNKNRLWDYLKETKPSVLCISTDLLDSIGQVAQIRKLAKRSKIIIWGEDNIALSVDAMYLGADYYILQGGNITFFLEQLHKITGLRRKSHSVWASKLDGFLRGHFTNSSLKLSTLCDHFGISSSYATRLFREHIGMSFHKYLSFYRVEEAKRHLADTKDRVYEIADKCGFTNSNHLIRVFFDFTNMSPEQYRQSLQEMDWLAYNLSGHSMQLGAPQHLMRPNPLQKKIFRYDNSYVTGFAAKDVFKCAK